MKLEIVYDEGLHTVYAISNVKKEFKKAVGETWKDEPPWQRFQKKLLEDLVVLDQEMEKAIDLQCFEKLTGETDLYSIRHPEAKKNVRVIYTIIEDAVVLLTAFLENNDGDYRRAISVAKKRVSWLQND